MSGDLAGAAAPLPADAVTASASGLDPEISPQNALSQVGACRGCAQTAAGQRWQRWWRHHTEGRLFGLIGEPRVNVLALNLALDKIAAK